MRGNSDPVTWPPFFDRLFSPGALVPGVEIRVIGEDAQAVFFKFTTDADVPLHSHPTTDKWGVVVQGRVDLTVEGRTSNYVAGDSYLVAAGLEHGAHAVADTRLIEVFGTPRF